MNWGGGSESGERDSVTEAEVRRREIWKSYVAIDFEDAGRWSDLRSVGGPGSWSRQLMPLRASKRRHPSQHLDFSLAGLTVDLTFRNCCSVAQSCSTLFNLVECSTPAFPVFHCLLEFAQTLVHWVDEAIQPSHPLLSPSPPSPNLSQHQGLFQGVSSLNQVAKVLQLKVNLELFSSYTKQKVKTMGQIYSKDKKLKKFSMVRRGSNVIR